MPALALFSASSPMRSLSCGRRLARLARPSGASFSKATAAAGKSDAGKSDVPVEQRKGGGGGGSSALAREQPRSSSAMERASVWPGMGLSTIMSNPFELMRTDPFTLGARLLHDMEAQLGLEPTGEVAEPEMAPLWAAVDIKENKDSFTLSVDVPGMSASDVKVSVDNGILNISGERRKETKSGDATWNRVERSYGAFERCFKLPPAAKEDNVVAKLDAGVLHVTIPKDEAKAPKSKQIKVEAAQPAIEGHAEEQRATGGA